MRKKIETIVIYSFIYAMIIFATSYVVDNYLQTQETLVRLAIGTFLASVGVFVFCILFDSFSINDPFWTVEASCISIYHFVRFKEVHAITWRAMLITGLVNLWSLRLTANLVINGMHNIRHEDWRFAMFRSKWKPKVTYLLMGFVSFILLPNMLVFVSCIPIYYATQSNGSLNYLDYLALCVTLLGIYFETVADHQLRSETQQKRSDDPRGGMACMDKGLWSLCRHPNYFGEVTFWYGVYIFSLAALDAGAVESMKDFSSPQTQAYLLIFLFGPMSIFSLIYFGSLPMMEQRQLKRRTNFYKTYMSRVPFKILPLNGFVSLYKSIKNDQMPPRRGKKTPLKPKFK